MNISPNVYAGPDALTACAGVGASCLAHELDPDLDPRPGLSPLPLFAPVGYQPFRAYPRLTAPNRGKTRLIVLVRAKIFSGGSRASIRGCAESATRPATALQELATTCTNSHQLAALAPTCAKKNSPTELRS